LPTEGAGEIVGKLPACSGALSLFETINNTEQRLKAQMSTAVDRLSTLVKKLKVPEFPLPVLIATPSGCDRKACGSPQNQGVMDCGFGTVGKQKSEPLDAFYTLSISQHFLVLTASTDNGAPKLIGNSDRSFMRFGKSTFAAGQRDSDATGG
jgi:hypothetical protein